MYSVHLLIIGLFFLSIINFSSFKSVKISKIKLFTAFILSCSMVSKLYSKLSFKIELFITLLLKLLILNEIPSLYFSLLLNSNVEQFISSFIGMFVTLFLFTIFPPRLILLTLIYTLPIIYEFENR